MRGRSSDFWLGIVVSLAALALILVVIPVGVVTPKNPRNIFLSPDFWPGILAWSMLGLGVLLIIQSLATSSQFNSSTAASNGWAGLRLCGLLIILIAYAWSLERFGMVWSSMLVYALIVLMVKAERRILGLVVAITLPLALYGFFAHVAGVGVPQGEWIRLP